MKMPWSNRTGPGKFLIVCTTVLLVDATLCGVQIAIVALRKQAVNLFVWPVMILGYTELAVMLLAIIGIMIAVLWFFLRLLTTKKSALQPR